MYIHLRVNPNTYASGILASRSSGIVIYLFINKNK